MTFWLLFAFDAALSAGLLAFFLAGIGDGSVSGFNLGLWLPPVGITLAILAGSLSLWRKGRSRPAIGLLLVPALPGIAFLLFFAMIVATQPDWH